ncbi:hypothetical protein GCM10010124_21660 [Pilimelia terevasa]|uniref:DUF11 domain-containing protein n=1 Tax=Pilimelia terevasa TaxID=53372 RepID=A0A8J3BP57_9ACTN|nr:hypothetical protein [Pilimelia terevasa]GGK28627.1 hypothetical protein GCM10010124_21660 [Pilimelia terevasa]
MRTHPVGHALVVLGLVGAVAAPVVGATAAPSVAASVYLYDVTVAAGGAAKAEELYVDTAGAPVTLNRATVTYDYRDAAAVVRLAAAADPADEDRWESCTAAPGRLTCRLPAGWTLRGEGDALPEVRVAAADGAALHAAGQVTTTLADPAIGTTAVTSRVRVGERADLRAAADPPLSAEVDGGFTRSLGVTNAGRRPVEGVVAVFEGTHHVVDADTDYGNCHYADGVLRYCYFAGPLAPGRTYRTSLPMHVAARAYAPGVQASTVTWLTRAEAEDAIDADSVGEPGDGAPLLLRLDRRAARVAPPAADHADGDRAPNTATAEIDVTGVNGTDVAVSGSTVHARPGDTVDLRVGYAVAGPAALEAPEGLRAVTAVDVTLPLGVTVVEDPDGCSEVGERTWRCYASARYLAVGAGEECAFTVKVNRIVDDGAGEVALVTDDPAVQHRSDDRSENDTAALRVLR